MIDIVLRTLNKETTTIDQEMLHRARRTRGSTSKQIGVVVSSQLHAKVERLAERERRSLSQLGAMAIEEFLERRMPEGEGDGA
jgi:predicted HicB family RNase H-like nuclease